MYLPAVSLTFTRGDTRLLHVEKKRTDNENRILRLVRDGGIEIAAERKGKASFCFRPRLSSFLSSHPPRRRNALSASSTLSLVPPPIPIHFLDFPLLLPPYRSSFRLPAALRPLPTCLAPLAAIRSLASFYSGCLSIAPAL